MSFAATLIAAAQIYCLIGALVAAIFLTIGMDRIDEDARGAYAFRPLLIPAILMIWPLVLWRWFREEFGYATLAGRYAPPRNAHGVVALVLAGVIVATLLLAFSIRQTWPADMAPVRLSPPEAVE